MKIATKTGDKGTTGLLYGNRTKKSDIVFDVIGTLDELSAHIGVAKAHLCDNNKAYRELLSKVQKDLILLMGEYSVGDQIITYIRTYGAITEADLDVLDKEVELLQDLPELRMKDWVLYGGTVQGAFLDVASKVCRTAERFMAKLKDGECKVTDRPLVFCYINRLSDLLFLMARYADFFYKAA